VNICLSSNGATINAFDNRSSVNCCCARTSCSLIAYFVSFLGSLHAQPNTVCPGHRLLGHTNQAHQPQSFAVVRQACI
jgi:hypothetical protein